MSAPSEEPSSTRSLRSLVSKRRGSSLVPASGEEKKSVLRRGKSVLKNVAGGVRKSVSVGEGLTLNARKNHDLQGREFESATQLSVCPRVLQEHARERSEQDPRAYPVQESKSLSASKEEEEGLTTRDAPRPSKPRKTVTIRLDDESREKSKLPRELRTDPKSEEPSPPHNEKEEPGEENAANEANRASYRKRSIRVEEAPDDGGSSYLAQTGRIKVTGIVERSMAAAVISAARQRGLSKKTKPPLPTRPPHHRPHGGYCNPWDSALKESGLRTRGGSGSRTFFHKVAKDRRPPDEQLASMLLLAGRPDFKVSADTLEKDKYALATHWIGHSTFVLQTQGLTILTDPVWSARLGPLGPKRLVPPPCEIDELPETIDVVILSSACYDAFDKNAIQQLEGKVHNWLVPLGVKILLTSMGIDKGKVTELDWWQEHRVKGCLFACTPAQHYSVRDDALWCSWVIHATHHRIFFCGATGYRSVQRENEDNECYEYRSQFGGPACPVFKEIRRRYGPCDTSFLPIGGFRPRVLMSGVQGDAVDMLSVHRDLRSRRTIGHRWGTFSCADEGMLDAVRTLEAGLLSSPVAEHEFSYLKHGRLHVS